MKYSVILFSVGMLAIALLLAGCTTVPTSTGGNSNVTGGDPIIGAWIAAPDPNSSARELWLFNESGQFDAGSFSADPSTTLPYEYYLTGSWEHMDTLYYNITGDGIELDHTTMTYQMVPVNATLVYDPAQDALHPEGIPGLSLTRASHEPQVPPGINFSFPTE
jgi:hypothetical protein